MKRRRARRRRTTHWLIFFVLASCQNLRHAIDASGPKIFLLLLAHDPRAQEIHTSPTRNLLLLRTIHSFGSFPVWILSPSSVNLCVLCGESFPRLAVSALEIWPPFLGKLPLARRSDRKELDVNTTPRRLSQQFGPAVAEQVASNCLATYVELCGRLSDGTRDLPVSGERGVHRR